MNKTPKRLGGKQVLTCLAIARNLVGFRSTTLRVKVLRSEGEYVWVVTADLLDAGTNLVLNASHSSRKRPRPSWFTNPLWLLFRRQYGRTGKNTL